MRSSALVAFVALVAVSPSLAAPVSSPANASNARRATTSSTTPPASLTVDESGAIKLPSLGTIGTIFSVGAPIISGIIDHFKNGGDQQQQRRDIPAQLLRINQDVPSISQLLRQLHPVQRRELTDIFARAEIDESGAIKLPSLGTIGTVLSFGAPLVSGIIDHFKNQGSDQQQQQARELEALFARAEVDESGAIKLPSLGDAANIASIGSSIVSVFHNIFGGSDNQQRDLMDILARAEADESGAIKLPSLGSAANIASIGSSIVSVFHNLFGGNDQQRRELEDILARAEIDESGAFKLPSLGTLANIGSIGGSAVSILHNLFGGSSDTQQQRRELTELLARAEVDESGALKLGTLANIAGIGGSAIGILHSLFGGSSDSQQQRRELMDLLARSEVDESGALKLGTLANIAGIGGTAISILGSLFGGSSDNQQQRRELMDLLARAEVDESGALKLPSLGTLANIGSLGGSAISILHNIFGGSSDSQQQRREFMELLARAEVDESGALKLPSFGTLANIGSIGGSAISILHNLFGGSSDSQQQQRELMDILARADIDESGALKLPSLGTLGTIFSIGAPVVSGIIDHFKNGGDQQQSREFMEELLARAPTDESDALNILRLLPHLAIPKPVVARSLNDLD